MTALDTDVLSDVLRGDPALVARLALIPAADQFVPVVVVGEILRGRFAAIRQAEAGKGQVDLPRAYELLQQSVRVLGGFQVLPSTVTADTQFRQWRAAKIRVGSQDLRIAAICIDHRAKLVTRYAQVPGLNLEVWT